MIIRFGNLTPREFAQRVGAEFTTEELRHLTALRSGNAKLTGPQDFHIFEDPLCITVGSVDSHAMEIFTAANARHGFEKRVPVALDQEWKEATK
jgi:hypothetical protein